jgi:CheY-like chemotaxis protein/HPt (histidine-containing phosphotransfer) domain-containing protein
VNQKVVSNLLGKIGCDHKIANNGLEALEILAREKFDLILMDCHMPKMDGYEAATAIRSGKNVLQPDIPIIAATANVVKGEKEKCLAVGMNDYISKPMALDDLQTKIAKWLSKDRTANEETPSLINPAALQKLNELNGEDEDLYQEIVKIFVDTFPKDLVEMRDMLNKSEYLDLSERAHRVKSTCNHLGITTMTEICLFIEHNSFPKNCTALRKSFDDLEGLYKKALVEFQKMPKVG